MRAMCSWFVACVIRGTRLCSHAMGVLVSAAGATGDGEARVMRVTVRLHGVSKHETVRVQWGYTT